MATSQAWRRRSYGYELRVYPSGNGWKGEIRIKKQIFTTDEFGNPETAREHTCRLARYLAGLPAIPDTDACDNMSAAAKEWAISADQNGPSRHDMMAMKMSPDPHS
jgi:hypothetical protein